MDIETLETIRFVVVVPVMIYIACTMVLLFAIAGKHDFDELAEPWRTIMERSPSTKTLRGIAQFMIWVFLWPRSLWIIYYRQPRTTT